jgi:hypothetical protein
VAFFHSPVCYSSCRRGAETSLTHSTAAVAPNAPPSSRAQCPVGYPVPSAKGPGARVCGYGCSQWQPAASVLSGAWYEFAVAPRRTSSGHALYVCATGAAASCAPRRCALGQTRSGLAVWVAGPRRSGAAKTAGSGEQEGGGEGRLTGFDPPWLLFVRSDVMSYLDNQFLSTSDSELFHNRSKSLRVRPMKKRACPSGGDALNGGGGSRR